MFLRRGGKVPHDGGSKKRKKISLFFKNSKKKKKKKSTKILLKTSKKRAEMSQNNESARGMSSLEKFSRIRRSKWFIKCPKTSTKKIVLKHSANSGATTS